MFNSHLSRAALYFLALATLACRDSNAPDPATLTLDDLLTMSAIPMRASASAAALGAASPAVSVTSSGCAYQAATQRFVCPTVTANGITLNAYYQLLDAGGTAQSAFNASTTASLRMVRDLAGTVSASGLSFAVAEHHEQTLTGMLGGTHVLNGTGTGSATSTLITLTMTETINNVIFPPRGSASHYPLSGTITINVTSSLPTGSTQVVMTFNGSSTASMVVTGAVAKTCTVDLANPAAPPAC